MRLKGHGSSWDARLSLVSAALVFARKTFTSAYCMNTFAHIFHRSLACASVCHWAGSPCNSRELSFWRIWFHWAVERPLPCGR